ncbi:integrin beta-PS-like isoform X1 [Dreissena polymorpha]|nr:integrin beta-PS-like isoform X1 [Dreissena polymorpha]XP_052267258.1 integrin beta-PS-like isoform X1 [Dreissena polymorpha]XP_052267259.1 integrin beta-PS-like isoform X1 [Dreissena polymorpha]
MKEVLVWAVVGFMVSSIAAQVNEQVTNPCVEAKSCGQCIAISPRCGWCADTNYDKTYKDRCDLLTNFKEEGCSPANISNPQNKLSFVTDRPVQDGLAEGDAIQIQPQSVNIKIRPNNPEKITMTFRLAENYPVDLYYLMDLSNSMKDDKENLAALGNKIAAEMVNITKNFRLGFGSFVDKVVMPYVSTVPSKLQMPCDGCEPPYSYKNQLKLDRNTSLFEEYVKKARVSGNLDAPEGGFDAIMQAVQCKTQIGWRDQSRKMLLFSTDAGFHFAGDGKLGGIVKPNDGSCHLDGTGKYTEAENQDYPSVSQISTKIRENSINVIFAVTEDQLNVYEKLSKYIEGSEATKLAADSSNIVQVIKNNYQRITSKVEMNTQFAENITVKFMSSCKTGGEKIETKSCEGLSIGDSVTFDIYVSVSDCPAEVSKRSRTFSIYPVGLSEKLEISLDLICECDCEKPDKEQSKSPLCNGNGTFECGQCTCDQGRYGKKCECDGSQSTSDESIALCRNPNSTSQVVCSGRGECVCGRCECLPRRAHSAQKYSGEFCNCDDYSCSYHDNQLCGGHGRCDCGTCKCDEGYEGDSCSCPKSKETCFTSKGLECNGVGVCECGVCKCNATSDYKGPTCEECPTCPGKCEENKNCALCMGFQTGKYTAEDCKKYCQHVTLVDEINEEEVKQRDDLNLCQFSDDEDDCRYFFTYKYVENNNVEVQVQKTKVCPESVNILAIVLGTIGGIVFFGLVLLVIWKIYTTIHDQREFAKFEKETQNAKWDTEGNPLYNPATSSFVNPAFDNTTKTDAPSNQKI